MKSLIFGFTALLAFTTSNIQANSEAPLEWLITSTLQHKVDANGHLEHHDSLVKEIFSAVDYDAVNDELKIGSEKSNLQLRGKLESFLNTQKRIKSQSVNEDYSSFMKEGKTVSKKVTLYRTTFKNQGTYYFNHVHTNISQDNRDLKFLKITPQKTFSLIESFLKKRRTNGTVAFTDHDTDKAYDVVAGLNKTRLNTLRGVEWGGSTHMCLVGIKKNWDNLPNGRKYAKEESIKQSRSSNGFRIINHPNRKTPFAYTGWGDADGVEVWNTILENSPFLLFKLKRSNNRAAFKQWADSLKLGKKYTAVAGSDFHFTIPCFRDRSLIYPVNFIPDSKNSETKELLHKGRSSFLTRPDAPKLTLRAKFVNQDKWAQMGETINGQGELEVRLFGDFSDTRKRIGGACYKTINSFYKLMTFWKKRRWEIRFYNLAGEVIAKRSLNPKRFGKKHFKAVVQIPVEKKEIIRAELWSVNKKSKHVDLLGATNPIYLN